MGSHKGVGRLRLYVPSPMRFSKRPSWFNLCIAREMKGKPGPKLGRYDKAFQEEFRRAAKKCSKEGMVK